MPRPKKTKTDIAYALFLSFAGLVLVVLLLVFPPPVNEEFAFRKPLIGTIFSAICAVGVLAVFSPSKCAEIFDSKKGTIDSLPETRSSQENYVTFEGHHPACGKYSAHVFRVQNKTLCAACVGLLFGGILALFGSIAYFFVGLNVAENASLLGVFGIVCITVGLFQVAFKSLSRLFANVVFVFGAFLVLIAVDATVGSLFLDLFVVCLIVFWLSTRISLSRWDHERICFGCKLENCSARY